MPSPIALTANLQDIFSAAVNNSQVIVQLCGFGAQVPRIPGTSLLARTAPLAVNCTAGAFAATVWGNDVITPANTYYTFAILDDRKNVAQINAYQLAGSGPLDLSNLTPYNPGVVVVSGTTVNGIYVTLLYTATLPISGTVGSPASSQVTYDLTLTGNVTSSTFTNVVPGADYTFIIRQDGVGGRTFAWPSNIKNAETIDGTPNRINIQKFVADGSGNLYPVSGMTLN